MNSSQLAHGGTAWRTDRGGLAIWRQVSGVLVVAMYGVGSRDFAPRIVEAYEQIARPTPVQLFFDFEHLIGYDPPLRTELVLHFLPDRQRIRATHVLVKPHSSGTMMGAAVNAFRGVVDVIEERQRFEALLDERLSAEGVHDFSRTTLAAFART